MEVDLGQRLCVQWGRAASRKKGTALPMRPTKFLAHVYCGQTVGWVKMTLGTEVNLGTGDVVLDGVAGRSSPSP